MSVASSRWTRRCLAVGTAVSAACFAFSLLLDLLGRAGLHGDASDLAAVLGSAVALEPWGWATLGTLAVIATPAAGLVATLAEYERVRDRRTALLAVAVLAILGLSLVTALLR